MNLIKNLAELVYHSTAMIACDVKISLLRRRAHSRLRRIASLEAQLTLRHA